MKCVMVQGTSSGSGKTTVTALLCRHFARKGLKVVPFKAQNLSLNSFVTAKGEELGISQAFQAWACGQEPDGDMNPILLKPREKGSCQIVLRGRPYADIRRGEAGSHREALLRAAKESYDRLAANSDVVVIEGMGSPAEINLRSKDIANMTTAEMVQAPVILVGDIERGGVFAALYGTYELLEERHRRLVKAFLINRFRGDVSILGSGIKKLEDLMGVPGLGVLPFVDLRFPAEDSLDLGRQQGRSASGEDIRDAWLNNLDIFYQISRQSIDYAAIEKLVDGH